MVRLDLFATVRRAAFRQDRRRMWRAVVAMKEAESSIAKVLVGIAYFIDARQFLDVESCKLPSTLDHPGKPNP